MMRPAMFTATFTLGGSGERGWKVALEHDPGDVRPKAGGKRGETLRWTGAATNLHLGPLRFCVVWKDDKTRGVE